jgi:hypothetical protein
MDLIMVYAILIVGAASSRDHAMIGYKAPFFRGWKPLPRQTDVKFEDGCVCFEF